MSILRLAFKGFIYNWRLSISLLIGTFIASSILTGSLLVGDSVKKTLSARANERIGLIKSALICGDRFVTTDLVKTLNQKIDGYTLSSSLRFPGTLSTPDKTKRSNTIKINGVDQNFWTLFGSNDLGSNYLAINRTLANQKKLQIGDRIIVKFEIPGQVSKDAPLSGESDKIGSISGNITHIVDPSQGGSFNLFAEQERPLNIFLPLTELQYKSDKLKRCNLILSNEVEGFEESINKNWSLGDIELRFRPTHKGFKELVSERVFISDKIESSIKSKNPNSESVISYLINDIKKDSLTVPYSVGTGIGNSAAKILGLTKPKANEVILNSWLKQTELDGGINAEKNDLINITFFAVKDSREFQIIGDGLDENGNPTNDTVSFKVSNFVNEDNGSLSMKWVPDFPGLDTAKNLASWESGMPLDTTKIRDSDELYWDKYRSAPKAFFNLEQAQELWGNRFGACTSILIASESFNTDEFISSLREEINLSDLGMSFNAIQKNAQSSVNDSLDFGSLFASLSGFIIISAFLLCYVFASFSVESRTVELGTYGAIGFTRRQIGKILKIEFLFSLILGSLLGAFGGSIYTKLALLGFSSIWSGATTGIEFVYGSDPSSFAIGVFGIIIFSYIVISLSIRNITRKTPRELLSADSVSLGSSIDLKVKKSKYIYMFICFFQGVLLMILGKSLEGIKLALTFYGSGFMFLLGFIFLFAIRLKKRRENHNLDLMSTVQISTRNAGRRVNRSLAVISTVALGVFLVVAVNAFRLGDDTTESNQSGTGGFEFFSESTLPIYENINDLGIRDQFGIEEYSLSQLKFFPFRRLVNSEEASCQNLNNATNPRILGTDPIPLAARNSFRFSSTIDIDDSLNIDSPWMLLNKKFDNKTIPIIGDQASVMWALKKKIGDSIEVIDGNGNLRNLQIVALLENSTLQGNLIISENNFLEMYPNTGGYQTFLIDSNIEDKQKLSNDLTKAFELRGFDIIDSNVRLANYSTVQNTYISIFSVLGGLGVLLGTVGVGAIIARSVLERRNELSIMRAIGFNKKNIHTYVLYEHLYLVFIGIFIGLISSLVSVTPSAFSSSSPPFNLLIIITISITVGSCVFCYIATSLSIKGNLIQGIKSQ